MKVKIKKLLKEDFDFGYTEIEEVRIDNGAAVDRAILTPADLISSSDGTRQREAKTDKDYINRIRDIVVQGRKIPYLYYAYKGVDGDGNITNNNNLDEVTLLQSKKAAALERRIENLGDPSMLMYLCDFGTMMVHHDEWDKRYEQRMKELLPARTYERMAGNMGYDRSEFQAGKASAMNPFSTVAVGKGSKPVFAQNVDFMYKTSPEPNRKVDPNDLWAFSIRLPLSMAYLSISGVQASFRKMLKMGPQIVTTAYNHWSQNEKEYRIRYAERMKQEGASWFKELPQLSFKEFNSNYVESRETVDQYKDSKGKAPSSWTSDLTPQMNFSILLMQPDLPSLPARESLLDQLGDPEKSKKIAKALINSMTNNKNDEIKRNIATNLQYLTSKHKEDPAIKNNLSWIQHAIQMYYIMGGK